MGALQNPEEVGQAMDRIEKEAIRMGGLVEDLLELARIDEAGRCSCGRWTWCRSPTTPRWTPWPPRRSAPSPSSSSNRSNRDSGDSEPPVVHTHALTPATGPIAFAGATLARLRSRRARSAAPDPEVVKPHDIVLKVPGRRAGRGEQDPAGDHQPDRQRHAVHAR